MMEAIFAVTPSETIKCVFLLHVLALTPDSTRVGQNSLMMLIAQILNIAVLFTAQLALCELKVSWVYIVACSLWYAAQDALAKIID
jgi:hypothetical protein